MTPQNCARHAATASLPVTRRRCSRPCVQGGAVCSRHTQWEVALLDLAQHYADMGWTTYGSYVRAFRSAAMSGCANRRAFRTVVAGILDVDKWSTGIVQMANAAARGRMRAALAGGGQ